MILSQCGIYEQKKGNYIRGKKVRDLIINITPKSNNTRSYDVSNLSTNSYRRVMGSPE